VSCVRAGGTSASIGFLDDAQRMNVALTRAKYALWVVGTRRALEVSQVHSLNYLACAGEHARSCTGLCDSASMTTQSTHACVRCNPRSCQLWGAFLLHAGRQNAIVAVPDESVEVSSLCGGP
jgi:hypothetical protein